MTEPVHPEFACPGGELSDVPAAEPAIEPTDHPGSEPVQPVEPVAVEPVGTLLTEATAGSAPDPLLVEPGIEPVAGLPQSLTEAISRPMAAPVPIPQVAGRRGFARTTPVVVDRGRASFGLPSFADRRQLGQVGLVVLMVAALGALLLARLSPPSSPGVGTAGSPSPHGSVAASPRPSPHGSSSPAVSPSPSSGVVPGSPAPSAAPRPKTYTVKSGDTLSSIAARFRTTARIIEQLNGLKSPFVIHPGEILKLP